MVEPAIQAVGMRRMLLFLFCLSSVALARPWVVAHRGGTKLGAENALPTFEKAIALGVDAIELDIHLTRDNGLVVIHDETVDRTFPGHTGAVGEMTEQEASAVGLPTLAQALEVCKGRCKVFVEIKHPHSRRYEGIEKVLLQVLEEHDMLDQVVVISFDAESLRVLRQLEPKLATAYLSSKALDPWDIGNNPKASYASPHFKNVDGTYVDAVHAAGLKISVWTVDDRESMQRMRDLGCDAVTTNDPELLLDVVDPR